MQVSHVVGGKESFCHILLHSWFRHVFLFALSVLNSEESLLEVELTVKNAHLPTHNFFCQPNA